MSEKYYFVTLVESKFKMRELKHESSYYENSNQFFNAATNMHPISFLKYLRTNPILPPINYRIVGWKEITKDLYDEWVNYKGVYPV